MRNRIFRLGAVAAAFMLGTAMPSSAVMADGWTSSKIPAPPKDSRVKRDHRGLAAGDFTVILAKGGPTGYYVWCHLHAHHKGRTGSTRYSNVTPMVLGDGGYPYFVGPKTTLTVGGVLDKPDNNKHKWGTWKLNREQASNLEDAINNRSGYQVHAAADRNRTTILQHAGDAVEKEIGRYMDGDISRQDLIRLLMAKATTPA